MATEGYDSFESVKARLDEIVDAVGADDIPLDEALTLYEEAVALGLRASDLLEENISQRDAEAALEDGADSEDACPAVDPAAAVAADAAAADGAADAVVA